MDDLKSVPHYSMLSLCIVLVLSLPTSVWAIKPHRCHGRIQFSPCKDPPLQATPALPVHDFRLVREKAPPPVALSGPRYARLISSSFVPLNATTGKWIGKVQGNGFIEMELIIFRGKKVEATRYMGNVWLKNKTTPFTITSALPAGKGWSWKLRVWTR